MNHLPLTMAYEVSETVWEVKFGKFINQFKPEIRTLVRKLERILIKLYTHVSISFNQTCLVERMLPNYTHARARKYTHTHTHTHIYIYIYIYFQGLTWNNPSGLVCHESQPNQTLKLLARTENKLNQIWTKYKQSHVFSVASTEKDIDTRLTKARTAINRLSIIWKSDLTDKMKRSFFQAAVTSILLYGCTTWTLTKRLEKKLDGNYTRMLRAILNKSWRQYPTRHQLYGHLPPITKTIQARRTRHAGHCWRSRDELISDVLLWTPHMAVQKQDDQHEHTFSNYVRIQDVVQKTCLRRWTIGKIGVRGSGISVLPTHDDYDDDELVI